jgi:hypothetical protein
MPSLELVRPRSQSYEEISSQNWVMVFGKLTNKRQGTPCTEKSEHAVLRLLHPCLVTKSGHKPRPVTVEVGRAVSDDVREGIQLLANMVWNIHAERRWEMWKSWDLTVDSAEDGGRWMLKQRNDNARYGMQ